MKKKLAFSFLINIFTINIYSQNLTYSINSNSFSEFKTINLTETIGYEDKKYLVLQDNEYNPTPDTDLLLHFNDNFQDSADNYIIEKHYNNLSNRDKTYGSSSAYFLKNQEIVYKSKNDSMFSPGRILTDFTIEFWVNPAQVAEDTTIFSWKGVNKVSSNFISQKIKFYFSERKAVWLFENFFMPSDFSLNNIKLTSKKKILPDVWNHFLIRYKSETGIIEFLINGQPEDIKYSTKTEKEDIVIYPPYVGNYSKNEIFIGEKFSGFLDELRISEQFIENPNLNKYKDSGSFISPVIDINKEEIIFYKFNTVDIKDNESEIFYSYRVSDEPFLMDNSKISWENSLNIKTELPGRYIQFKGELFSNGNNSITPQFNNIEILWNNFPQLPSPIYLDSESTNTTIELFWTPVKHFNVDGYLLYIGESSGIYNNVIDVGNVTSFIVENLTNKHIYYFSLRSYNKNSVSNFSNEIYNRTK